MMKWLWFLLALTFTLSHQAGAKSPQQSLKSIAIVLGYNHYERLMPLNFAVNDADMVAGFLEDKGFQVYKHTDTRFGIRVQANHEQLESSLLEIAQQSQAEQIDTVLFFFSGHGVHVDGIDYLLFPQAHLSSGAEMLNITQELLPALRRINAKQIVVLIDACREYISASKGSRLGRLQMQIPKGLRIYDQYSSDKPDREKYGILVIHSAAPGDFAAESPDSNNGFFTIMLLEGLSDPDILSYLDLARYLRVSVKNITQQQSVHVQIPHISGDFDPAAPFDIHYKDQKKSSMNLSLQKDHVYSNQHLGNVDWDLTPLYHHQAFFPDNALGLFSQLSFAYRLSTLNQIAVDWAVAVGFSSYSGTIGVEKGDFYSQKMLIGVDFYYHRSKIFEIHPFSYGGLFFQFMAGGQRSTLAVQGKVLGVSHDPLLINKAGVRYPLSRQVSLTVFMLHELILYREQHKNAMGIGTGLRYAWR